MNQVLNVNEPVRIVPRPTANECLLALVYDAKLSLDAIVEGRIANFAVVETPGKAIEVNSVHARHALNVSSCGATERVFGQLTGMMVSAGFSPNHEAARRAIGRGYIRFRGTVIQKDGSPSPKSSEPVQTAEREVTGVIRPHPRQRPRHSVGSKVGY